MGRNSIKKARKVRIEGKTARTIDEMFPEWLAWRDRGILKKELPKTKKKRKPDFWSVVDLETGIEIEKFDSVKAAKNFCIERDYDFGQFGRFRAGERPVSGRA